MKNSLLTMAFIMAGTALGADAFAAPGSNPTITLNDAHFVSSSYSEQWNDVKLSSVDWNILDNLVAKDTTLTPSNKISFHALLDIYNPLARDKALRKAPYYQYLREILYPKASVETISDKE